MWSVVRLSAVVALFAVGCSASVDPSTESSVVEALTTTTSVPASTDVSTSTASPIPPTSIGTTSVGPTSTLVVPGQLIDVPIDEVVLNGSQLVVAVASTTDDRVQGLMGVTDLGDLDGMLFVWAEDTTSSFWMENTLIPLDIAFFAANGDLVGLLQMEPCVVETCPLYEIDLPYRYALEMVAGRLTDLPDGSRLEFPAGG